MRGAWVRYEECRHKMRPLNMTSAIPTGSSRTLAVYVDLRLLLNLRHEEPLNSCQISISCELQELFFWVQLLHEALQKTRRRKRLKRRMSFISPNHTKKSRCFRGTKSRGVRSSLASESQTCRLKVNLNYATLLLEQIFVAEKNALWRIFKKHIVEENESQKSHQRKSFILTHTEQPFLQLTEGSARLCRSVVDPSSKAEGRFFCPNRTISSTRHKIRRWSCKTLCIVQEGKRLRRMFGMTHL